MNATIAEDVPEVSGNASRGTKPPEPPANKRAEPRRGGERAERAMKGIAWWAAGGAGVIALVVLAGYVFGVRQLTSFAPSFVSARPVAAFALLAAAVALLLQLRGNLGSWARAVVWTATGYMVAIATFTLVEWLGGVDLGIDRILFAGRLEQWHSSAPGRMSLPTALSLALLGGAIALLDWETRRKRRPAQWLALLGGIIGVLALQGYSFGVATLSSFGLPIAMSAPVAVSLILLALAILFARPEAGWMRALSSSHAGGAILRWYLPVTIGCIWLLGWFSQFGFDRGWYSKGTDQLLFALPLTMLFAFALVRMAQILNRAGEVEEQRRDELHELNRGLENRVQQRTAELQRSEERYRSLVTATAQVVWTTDPTGAVEDMPMWRELTGQTVDQVRGWGWLDAIHPADRERTRRAWDSAVRQQRLYDIEYRIRDRAGAWRDLAARGVPVCELDGSIREWVGTCTDITERRQAEEAVRRAERYNRSLLEASLDPLVTISREGKITDVNIATERLTGKNRRELIGTDFCDYFTAPAEARGGYERVFAEGSVYDYPLAIRSTDGRVTDVLYNATVFKGEAGEIEGVFAAARDITARKRAEAEIRALNAELEARVAARTAELATANHDLEAFTYSVAHDLRTPLRHVHGFVTLLAEDYAAKLDEQGRGYVQHIVRGSEHMGHLIDDLLNLSRVGRRQLQPQIVGLRQLLEEVKAELQAEQAGRELEWRVGDLPFVECDPALMRQVFHNLVANALKFTRPRNPAVIEVGARVEHGETVLFVADNGVGFNMKYADKLFGVFQRLHRAEDFEGTGVGLVTVQRIIQKHGGRIWAEAELDHGATFYFTLGTDIGAAAPEPSGGVRAEPVGDRYAAASD